jgi:hypothetical protein
MNSNTQQPSAGAPAADEAPFATPIDWSPIPVARGSDDSVVVALLERTRREPALLFTTAYLLVSVLGLWCSYWVYAGFKLPILEYLQASDFLVAGLRDPVYVLLLLLGMAVVLAVSWPETLRLRNADKLEQLRRRTIWWPMVLTRSMLTSWDGTGLRPLTAMVLAVAGLMALLAAGYVTSRGEAIREQGRGEVVTVQFNGDAAPQRDTARLLGSSSAFVFLRWPRQQRAEAVPIATIKRLQAVTLAPAKPPAKAVPAVAAPR